jgi:tetratricopeptide (TPR) repeat protein
MDKKFTSIQELENIRLDDYKDKPEELIRIGKDLLKAKRFEKSIEVFELALKQKIKMSNDDEFSVDCAKYYYYYANALINKLLETCDMFQENVKQIPEVADPSVNQNNNFQLIEENLNQKENHVNINQTKKTNMIDEEENKTDIQHDMKNYELSDNSQNEEEEEEEESDERVLLI